ncbi:MULTISPECIES: hypothetical protein [Glutamicibacter]|nr:MULTISPECIES: hypothetical protein [Glutamicibacter]MBF6670515.1 hypothetical protein [Glutamicibacter sp. FBE19]
MSTFGIEEEFFLFDGETGLPADSAGGSFGMSWISNVMAKCKMNSWPAR